MLLHVHYFQVPQLAAMTCDPDALLRMGEKDYCDPLRDPSMRADPFTAGQAQQRPSEFHVHLLMFSLFLDKNGWWSQRTCIRVPLRYAQKPDSKMRNWLKEASKLLNNSGQIFAM